MDFQYIEFEIVNQVAWIRMNRPEVFNSVHQPMAFELHHALDICRDDASIRCVVMTGNGRAFCAGQDLKEVTDPNGPELASIVKDHYNPLILRIRQLPKPVVMAVNGVAAGAGANIALCGDIVLAVKEASFIQAFSKIGLIPDSAGTFFLPRLIGWSKASALMMTGEKVSADDAVAMNMIYKSIPSESFLSEVQRISEELAAMPTYGLALTKQALNRSLYNDLEGQLSVESELQTLAGQSEDYNEGVQAFIEKRKPVFKGK